MNESGPRRIRTRATTHRTEIQMHDQTTSAPALYRYDDQTAVPQGAEAIARLIAKEQAA